MPTRPPGASRRFARRAGRAGPGCGPRSATTRSTSTSPSRSAEAAHKLFAEAVRSSSATAAYEAGAPSRGTGDPCVLESSKANFIECAAGQVSLTQWRGMDRADRVDLPPQRCAPGALRPRAQAPDAGVRRGAGRAEEALDALFAHAERETKRARARRCARWSRRTERLRQVPMDNISPRVLRGPVIGRRCRSAPTARPAPGSAVPRRPMSLEAWLTACAQWRPAARRPVRHGR